MRAARRPVSLFLSACLLLAAAGCYSAQDFATEGAQELSPGMTMAEVAARLGDPDLVVRGDPGTETTWTYRYTGGPGTVCTIFIVVFSVVLVIGLIALAAKGGGGGGGNCGCGSWGGGSDPPCHLKLRFDPKGRLAEFYTTPNR